MGDIYNQQDSSGDKLRHMFYCQTELQKQMDNIYLMRSSSMGWQRYVNLMCLALVNETSEIINETRWKDKALVQGGWKSNMPVNMARMQYEIVDAMQFIINLAIASDMDADDLFSLYLKKFAENEKRIKEKY